VAVKVNWYDKNVLMVMEDAMDDILTSVAFQVEGHAKVDAPVDTGFMRNAIYTIEADSKSHYNETDPNGEYTSKNTGEKSLRVKAPEEPPKDHTAIVHAAASYTIYQEMKKSFLYKALKTVKREVGGIIKIVAKERNLD